MAYDDSRTTETEKRKGEIADAKKAEDAKKDLEEFEKWTASFRTKASGALALLTVIVWGFFFTSVIFGQEQTSPELSLLATIALVFLETLVIFVRWTKVKENSSKTITRGDAVDRIVFAGADRRLATQEDVDAGRTVRKYNLIEEPGHKYAPFGLEWLGKLLGGIRFYVWILETVYVDDQDWLKSMPDGTIEPRHQDNVDHILTGYQYPYGLILGDGINTKDNFPVNVRSVITAMIVNPYSARHFTKWFETLIAEMQPPIKDFINTNEYAQLLGMSATPATDELLVFLRARMIDGRHILQILEEDHGIRVVRVGFAQMDLTDEHVALVLREKTARINANAARTEILGFTTLPFMDMVMVQAIGVDPSLREEDPVEARKLHTAYEAKVVQFHKDYADDYDQLQVDYPKAFERSEGWINRMIDARAGGLRSVYLQGNSSPAEDLLSVGASLFGGGFGGGTTAASHPASVSGVGGAPPSPPPPPPPSPAPPAGGGGPGAAATGSTGFGGDAWKRMLKRKRP